MKPYGPLQVLRTLVLLLALLFAAGGWAAAGSGKVRLSFEPTPAALARGAQSEIDVIAVIDRGWHIQAHQPSQPFLIPTELSLVLPAGVTAAGVDYPRPETTNFAFASGKPLRVYQGKIGMSTAVHVPADFSAPRLRIAAQLRYQACNDSSCLRPMTVTAEMWMPVVAAAGAGEEAAGPRAPPGVNVGRWFTAYGSLGAFLLVALLGVGLNLTPCVYPLIAVTVGFFGSQARGTSRRVFWLALAYVAGIAATFSTVGVMAALSGGLFGAALQKPAVVIGVAAILALLALSSFGLYELRPPATLLRLGGRTGGGMAGALAMGLTMGVVAAPCVGPVVLGLLVFVGAQQDPFLGFALFFTLSLGMGAPYVALALAAGSLASMPRSGEWLVWVEHFFGFVLLGFAAYFIAPLLPAPVAALAVPAVATVGGIYLGLFDVAGNSLRYFRGAKRVAGLVVLALAVWAGFPRGTEGSIQWRAYADDALAVARAAGIPAVVNFSAAWCLPCKEMEQTTFADPDVTREANHFHMIKVDLTEENEVNDKISAAFDVRGVPTAIFFNAEGREVRRLVGFIARAEMLDAMRSARDGRTAGGDHLTKNKE